MGTIAFFSWCADSTRVYTNLMRFPVLSRNRWRISWARAIQFQGLAIPSGLFRLVFRRIATLSSVTANCVCFFLLCLCWWWEFIIFFNWTNRGQWYSGCVVGWIGYSGIVMCMYHLKMQLIFAPLSILLQQGVTFPVSLLRQPKGTFLASHLLNMYI